MELEILELESNNFHIFINGSVNGRPCRLLIDTGASRTVLDRNFVLSFEPSIELKEQAQPGSGLGTNTMKIETALLDSFIIGTKGLECFETAVLDLMHVNSAYEKRNLPPVHIILGNDIMKSHNAIIDYGKKTFFVE